MLSPKRRCFYQREVYTRFIQYLIDIGETSLLSPVQCAYLEDDLDEYLSGCDESVLISLWLTPSDYTFSNAKFLFEVVTGLQI